MPGGGAGRNKYEYLGSLRSALPKSARPSSGLIPRSCGPPKVDILPSTRKRISSGCTGNGRPAAILFRTFGRDFEVFALFVTRAFRGECREAGLRDLGLRLGGGIRLYLLRRWPGLTASIPKRFQDAAIEAAQNVSH